MTDRPQRRLDRTRETIESHEDLDEADRELLQEFDTQLGLQNYSTERHLKLLRHGKTLAGVVETAKGPDETPDVTLTEAIESREAAEELVSYIYETWDNEETNCDMRVAFRMLAKYTSDGEDIPDTVSWVDATTSRSYSPTPDPANMYRWEEDVVPMIETRTNMRDRALIAVAFDAGPRAGELLDLRVGDVSDGEHGTKLSLDGKQGERSTTLFLANGHLSQWLGAHPAGDDGTAPLWCQLSDGSEQLTYQRCNDIIKKAGKEADIDKPITFTQFRKSSASRLARRGCSQVALEIHHGWTRGSDVAGRYIALFDEDVDRELARAHGLDIEEDTETPVATIECPRCGEPTPNDRPFCMHCQAATDVEASQVIGDLKSQLDDLAVSAEEADDRSKAIETRQMLEQKAGHFDVQELHQMLASLDSTS